MTNTIEIFMLMIGAHFVADYPLQGDFLSKAKNHTAPIPGVPWYQAMMAHCGIHALFVGIITGSIILSMLEFIVHALTDYSKCAGKIGFNTDQEIHLGTKLIIAALYAAFWVTP